MEVFELIMYIYDGCIQELLRRLLELMADPAYGIRTLNNIRSRASVAEIYLIGLDGRAWGCTWEVVPCAYSGQVLEDFKMKTEAIPQVIDFPPIFRNGSLVRLRPVVLAGDGCDIENMWVTVHELCHLLSIGTYELLADGRILHTSGLMSYVYEACVNGQVKGMASGDVRQNELFNDLVTWHFMERLFGKDKLPQRREELCTFRDNVLELCGDEASLQILIGKYFDGTIAACGGISRFQMQDMRE